MGQQWLAGGSGALSATVPAKDLLTEVAITVIQFILFQSLSHLQLLANPGTTTQKASLSITNSQSLLKLMSIEPVMPSNHLILCHPSPSPTFNLSQHWGLFK